MSVEPVIASDRIASDHEFQTQSFTIGWFVRRILLAIGILFVFVGVSAMLMHYGIDPKLEAKPLTSETTARHITAD